MSTILSIVVGLALLAVVVVGGAYLGWGYRMWAAPHEGKVQAFEQQQSGNNRVIQNSGFTTTYEDLQKAPAAIKVQRDALSDWDARNSGKQDNGIGSLANQRNYLQQTLDGIILNCQQTVANYNAAATAYISKNYLPAGYPQSYDAATYCK